MTRHRKEAEERARGADGLVTSLESGLRLKESALEYAERQAKLAARRIVYFGADLRDRSPGEPYPEKPPFPPDLTRWRECLADVESAKLLVRLAQEVRDEEFAAMEQLGGRAWWRDKPHP